MKTTICPCGSYFQIYYISTFDLDIEISSFSLVENPNIIESDFYFYECNTISYVISKYTNMVLIKESYILEFIQIFNVGYGTLNKLAKVIIPAFRNYKLNQLNL